MADPRPIVLRGCTPEPLGAYLKALGVLRVLALQEASRARGWWNGETFVVIADLDEDGLMRFFLEAYQPTPVLAPWNGGSGFWDHQTAGRALARLRSSTNPRLAGFRAAVDTAGHVLRMFGFRSQPKEKEKERLLRLLRARLPDDAVPWLDAAVAVTGDAPRYAPVLGSGGNDGRLDFTSNYIQNLERVIPFDPPSTGTRRGRRGSAYDPAQSKAWLEDSLFARSQVPLLGATSGQFHPGGVGGPNGTRGMVAGALVNPWDYVLLIEGVLTLSGAVARRLGTAGGSRASFPFTVDSTVAGSGTAAAGDVDSARGELWLPLWDQPADYPSVQYLLSEGRAQVGRRQARSGVDFARAAAGLGVDRGIRSFVRFGILSRNGKAYLAAPLGRIRVAARPHVHLVEQLDGWLEDWRRFARRDATPERFRQVLRDLESAIFHYCEDGSPTALQHVLAAVGRAERALAGSPREEGRPRPLSDLDPDWAVACDDGRPEFRIARAVASITDSRAGSLRVQLEPVALDRTHRHYRWMPGAATGWQSVDLTRNLMAVLERRLLESGDADPGRLGAPIDGRYRASLADVQAFLDGRLDEAHLADTLWGLITLRWHRVTGPRNPTAAGRTEDLSRAYALLKLLFWPGPLGLGGTTEKEPLVPDLAVLSLLRAGRLADAIELTCRRLWAAGLAPLGWRRGTRAVAPGFTEPAGGVARLAASLIVPLADPLPLARLVLQLPEDRA